jgi:hypothetical protein
MDGGDLPTDTTPSSPEPVSSRAENTVVTSVRGDGKESPEIKIQSTVSTTLSSYEG